MNSLNKHYFFLLLCISVFSFTVNAMGGKEKDVIQVTGVVRLVGNAPFSEYVISSSDNQYYIAAGEDLSLLRTLQHQTVTVQAKETLKEIRFASGRSAGTRRELKNIKIIAVQTSDTEKR